MMIQKKKRIAATAVFLMICLLIPGVTGAEPGKVFKIGYFEGGSYWIFTESLNAMKKELFKAGFGDQIQFPEDAWFSPGWDKEKTGAWEKSAKKLMARDDLGLIIAAGTAATKVLLEANNGKTPILAMSVSDPVKSKFVLSETDSGVDNFTVRIVPNRFKRMFEIFHNVVGFKKLGLLYVDDENGRKYANVDDAVEVSEALGFQLLQYGKLSSETEEDCMTGLKKLADQGMDAFYIPSILCFDWKKSDVKQLLDYLAEKKIPTFARNGTTYVKAGALMGFSTIDFSQRGQFLADKVIRIIQGESPRSLPMVDNATPKISLNLHVAEKIGFDPSFDILGASDELFQEITLPEDRLTQ